MDMVVVRELARFVFEDRASCKTSADGEGSLGRIITCKVGDLSEEAAGLLLLLLLNGRGLGRRVRGRRCRSLWRARVFPLRDARGRVEVEPRNGVLGPVLDSGLVLTWVHLKAKSKCRGASTKQTSQTSTKALRKC